MDEHTQAFVGGERPLDGYGLARCTDCSACSDACPFRNAMDLAPADVVRRVADGSLEEVIASRGI